MSKFSVRVENFTPRRSNTLYGFADILIPELRLRIAEVPILGSHGKQWAALPAKPMLDRDGCARRDERGRMAYLSILKWGNRQTSDAFSAAVIAALRERYPSAFEQPAA